MRARRLGVDGDSDNGQVKAASVGDLFHSRPSLRCRSLCGFWTPGRRAFFRAAQRIRLVAWQRLSDLASVLGEQQRHQLIDRCRWVAAGRGAQVVNRKPKYHRLKHM